jgi:hypothetical protein
MAATPPKRSAKLATRPHFTVSPAVSSARRRDRYIPCPACGSRAQRYLLHRAGVRFVMCRACRLVYADPVDPTERGYFDLEALGVYGRPADLRNVSADFDAMLQTVSSWYQRHFGRAPRSVLLLGRWHSEFAGQRSDATEVRLATSLFDDHGELVSNPLTETLGEHLESADVILLHEFLEGVSDPGRVLDGLATRLRGDTLLGVTFANMRSVPSRMLRRRWRSFFDNKVAFYDGENLSLMMWRFGFSRIGNSRLRSRYSAGYVAHRLELRPSVQSALRRTGLARLSASVTSGHELTLFKARQRREAETLSIIVPVFNEAKYVAAILTSLLELEIAIDHEIIVVESNSSDGSREIVQTFEGLPRIQTVYQDHARGKGNAVREGLAAATGSILMIQDADFEYDLDDYDALLEPILQRHASFVLGSRSLGMDDWRIRRYAGARAHRTLINVGQQVFERTFNLLYQQRATDINTMFKVFRRECIEGCTLTGDRFNFDIELVCKIVRNGFEPLEVPVNYDGRGYDEGKKVTLADALPNYYQLFRCRFGQV